MCMIVGDTHNRAGAFVATDTRVRYLDGKCDDPGGKIVRTASGWATGSGGFEQVMTALAALRDAPEQTGVDRTQRATDIVSGALSAAGLELRGWKEEEEIFGSSWATRGAVVLIEPRQEIVLFRNAESQVVYHAGAGPADFPDWDDTYLEMRADIESAQHDLGGRIRAAAKHFASTSRASTVMSGVMEVGWICPSFLGPFRGFLRGNAEEIADTEGRHILRRFHAEPPAALPPSSRHTASNVVVVDLAPSRLAGGGATPTISSPQGFWSGTNTIAGTDTAGRITLVHDAGLGSTQANGHQIKVTFAMAYLTAPFVLVSPVDFASGGHYTVGTVTTTDFWLDGEAGVAFIIGGAATWTDRIPFAVIA
jgi:hypothetical protein